ncbi:hypothetical protein HELRODRAFT_193130 [Helobdella robusta]|uniref:Protein O-mannosyl-transferase C-terminal four TM domain-containing protein n=1 Tax=Helobdella robusta TaxID=6412 RepID=T1FUN2_HELRO|nr:hypothetical protein HELRODRAFT_193130 [Helobdella robusta]ESN97898.1 hypothetical protein HELRODRAFT_193130 [Helobdella robusta]
MYTCVALLLAWCLHYMPYMLVNRVLYIHHYLVAALFKIVCAVLKRKFILRRLWKETWEQRCMIARLGKEAVDEILKALEQLPSRGGADWTVKSVDPTKTCYNWHHLSNCLTNINGHYYCNNCPHPSSNSSGTSASAGASRRPTSTSSFNSSACNKPSTSQAVNAGQLNFLQLNCNGIKNNLEEIQQHLINHNIHIAALQESKLTKGS